MSLEEQEFVKIKRYSIETFMDVTKYFYMIGEDLPRIEYGILQDELYFCGGDELAVKWPNREIFYAEIYKSEDGLVYVKTECRDLEIEVPLEDLEILRADLIYRSEK